MAQQLARSYGNAFTLLELLVALAVVSVLVIFTFSGMRAVTQNSRRLDSVSTMRNIGVALASHLTDRGRLPGPFKGYQYPQYRGAQNQLITPLWPYLGIRDRPPLHEVVPQYVPRHSSNWAKMNASAYLYELTPGNGIKSTQGGPTVYPWGYPPAAGAEDNQHQTPWNVIVASTPLATAIALQDIFATKKTETDKPKVGELQDYRTRLFLDWHVDTVKPN